MLFSSWKKCDIAWLKVANKQLEKLPRQDRSKIIRHINDINKRPEALDFKKLRGYQDLYRLRVGDYRIILKINKPKNLVVVAYIGHRKEVYDSLKKSITH